MDNPKKTILVPWDFTEKAEFAFAHALNVAKATGNTISLLHIVKTDREVDLARRKVQSSAEALKQRYQVKPDVLVKKGNIFKTISHAATEHNAEMVIMGTHGIRGMQKLTGSWALKVIVKSKIPFMVVQKAPDSPSYNKVVFPIDYKKENKEKIKWSSFVSKYFKVKYLIFTQNASDSGFKKKVSANVHFAKKYLDSNQFEFEVFNAPGKSDFAKETIDFAEQEKADMIMVITTRNIIFTDYMVGANEQKILANQAQIPVLCVNPRPGKFSGSFSATGN
jgi:nucleotide-binding universal stress UspA family protein